MLTPLVPVHNNSIFFKSIKIIPTVDNDGFCCKFHSYRLSASVFKLVSSESGHKLTFSDARIANNDKLYEIVIVVL